MTSWQSGRRSPHHRSSILLPPSSFYITAPRPSENPTTTKCRPARNICTMEKYYYGFDPFWPSASVAYNALPGSTHVGSTPTPSPHPVPFSPHSSTANNPVPRSFSACISCPVCYRKSKVLWGFDPPGHMQTQSAGRGDR